MRTAVLYAQWGAYPATLALALGLGVPAFLALRRRLRPTPLRCILVGAAVVAAPWILPGPMPTGGTGDAAVDGGATLANGRPPRGP